MASVAPWDRQWPIATFLFKLVPSTVPSTPITQLVDLQIVANMGAADHALRVALQRTGAEEAAGRRVRACRMLSPQA